MALMTSADSPTPREPKCPHPLQILLVEDSADGAASMAMFLRLRGHEVRVALDGHAAIREAGHNPPDVILLDIGMPGMDGYEVARRILGQTDGKKPFIVAVTGYGTAEDLRRCQEAGIDLHLLKPADPAKLDALLERFKRLALPGE